jgi:outer membrane receptor protein involved in Fe transport
MNSAKQVFHLLRRTGMSSTCWNNKTKESSVMSAPYFLSRVLVVAFSFLLLSFTLRAQDSATLSGTLKDQTGAVVAGGTVKALNTASGQEFTAAADGSGAYSIALLPGVYRVSASSGGLVSEPANVTLLETGKVTQDFVLVAGGIEDTITITAGKGTARVGVETPQIVTVASALELEQRRPQSSFEAIERAPNLITVETSALRARPRLRGLDSARVLIVIDGERLNNVRTDPQTGLSTAVIDVTQLESAEVVGGAGSSLYGSDSIGGTINLVTKAPTRPDSGNMLSFRLDGNYATQGKNRRGAPTILYSNPKMALRLSGAAFRVANYKMGGEAIALADAVRIGNFFRTIPGNNANQFPVFGLPANAEILNGQGHGFNDQIDFWVFPTNKHSIRYRQTNSQHYSLGNAASGPPFEIQERFNGYRRLDKYGVRYEGTALTRWLPRLAGGFYRQKFSFPQDQIGWSLNSQLRDAAGNITRSSSWETVGGVNVLTGNASTFTRSDFTNNKNTITSYGADVQATLAPVVGVLVTTGFQYLRDESRDRFIRFSYFTTGATAGQVDPATLVQGTSSPNSDYTDRAWFAQIEYDRNPWYRVAGGIRIDNWRTTAAPTPGYPLGSEFQVLNRSIPSVTANPGALSVQVNSLSGFAQLASGSAPFKTSSTPATGNLSFVLRLRGINPYIRFANSYREPSVSERYLLRNFTNPIIGFSALVVGNPNLEPERGNNLDVGVKVQKQRYSVSAGYFRNYIKNLVAFATPAVSTFCIPTTATDPLRPSRACQPFPSGHFVNFNGRINQGRVLIRGVEASYEFALPLGTWGSLNPFGSMGWLHGVNITANRFTDAGRINVINAVYNRNDTPLQLEGNENDVPLGSITPFRGIFGARVSDNRGSLFAEYDARYQAQVTRVDPNSLVSGTLTAYGFLRSFDAFTKQSIRGGYNWRREGGRFSFTVGIDNLTNRLYFEHFQSAPAPGRAFVFGFTTEFFNLLKK